MFGKDTAVYGIGAGLVAIIAYLLTVGQQDAERQVLKAEFAVESAKFDRDFSRAIGQTEEAKQASEALVVAKNKLEQAQQMADKKQAQKTAQEDAILAGARKDLKQERNGDMDLDAALEELK